MNLALGMCKEILSCFNALRLQDTVLSTALACCDSTRCKRHTLAQAWTEVEVIVLTKYTDAHSSAQE